MGAPEKSRGLSPANGSIISPSIDESFELKWEFVDTVQMAKEMDIVFFLDVSGSMHGYLSPVGQQIQIYLERLNNAGVKFRAGLLAYSDTTIGEQMQVGSYMAWNNSNFYNVRGTIDYSLRREWGGDWEETGLDPMAYAVNSMGLSSTAQKQFIMICDAPLKEGGRYYGGYSFYSAYNVGIMTDILKSRGITFSSVSTTDSTTYGQMYTMASATGGQNLTDFYGFGSQLRINALKAADPNEEYVENDSQTRVDINIWEISNSNTRSHIFSRTVHTTDERYSLKGKGIAFKEGGCYEWSVVTYDREGLASPMSDKAQFRYLALNQYSTTIPNFTEPILFDATIKKAPWREFGIQLYEESKKYSSIDSGALQNLFQGEIAFYRWDIETAQAALNQMKREEGLPQDRYDYTTIHPDILEIMRRALLDISISPPNKMVLKEVNRFVGGLMAPLSLNVTKLGTAMNLTWPRSEKGLPGYSLSLQNPSDSDLKYIKVYSQEFYTRTVASTNQKIVLSTDSQYYYTPEQVQTGRVFVTNTTSSPSMSMRVFACDTNGRVSESIVVQALDSSRSIGSDKDEEVQYYVIEEQRRSSETVRPDPNGAWSVIYTGSANQFSYSPTIRGSYWYRVSAVSRGGWTTSKIYSMTKMLV